MTGSSPGIEPNTNHNPYLILTTPYTFLRWLTVAMTGHNQTYNYLQTNLAFLCKLGHMM